MRRFIFAHLSVLMVASLSFNLYAQGIGGDIDPQLKEEIRYANGLMRLGLVDYQEKVIKIISAKFPSAGPTIKVMKLQNLLALGKFDEVKAQIAAQADPNSQDAWAMKLALADGYYAWSKYAEAEAIYRSFFTQYPEGPGSKALNDFYMNSAYKFAQMLLLIGEDKSALWAYNKILKATMPNAVKRQVMSEKAELMVKILESGDLSLKKAAPAPAPAPEEGAKEGEKAAAAPAKKALSSGLPKTKDEYVTQITDICNEILWKQDIWFGKAIVLMAHLKMIQEDPEGASKLIDEYLQQLKAIDAVLQEQGLIQLSPMAECRYMIGKIMQEKADDLMLVSGTDAKVIDLLAGAKNKKGKRGPGALKHFLNVFIRYPSSQWALDAGKRANIVENTLITKFGAKIKKADMSEHMANVRKARFLQAKVLFSQNQFEKAAEYYESTLNMFPESEQSVIGLSDLAKCYIELENMPYTDMVIRYMAERFSKNRALQDSTGNKIIALAEKFEELKMPDKKEWVYGQFFDNFTSHVRAPSMLLLFGHRKFSDDDFAGALTYYERIKKNHTTSPSYYEAMGQIATCQSKLGQTTNELITLTLLEKQLLAKDAPGHILIMTSFRLATAYRKTKSHNGTIRALKKYAALIKLVTAPDAIYHKTPEEKARNQDLLEGALYYKASCYSRIKKPKEKLDSYKKKSIEGMEQLVKKFPESKFAPAALAQVGTLWTMLNNPEEAEKALKKLQNAYPESNEAMNALFTLGNNLLQLGRRQEAVRIFKKMFKERGKYTPGQILMAGNELLKAGESEIALEAFNQVLTMSDKKTVQEPGLVGKGKALIHLKRFDEAAKAIDEMMKKYPTSGYTEEANIALSEAYSEKATKETDADKRFDLFNKSAEALQGTVRMRRGDAGKMADLDIRGAQIKKLKARAEEEFGTPEKATDYRNQAIASFQGLIMFGDPNSAKVRPYIEKAYLECLPLLAGEEKWKDAYNDCDTFIKLFPSSARMSEVRRIKNKAKIKLQTSGESLTDDENSEEATEVQGE